MLKCVYITIIIIYIYIYIYNFSDCDRTGNCQCRNGCRQANLGTKILDLRGFDSNIFLILRVGTFMPTGNFLDLLSQTILVGIILVGRLGVAPL